MKIQLFYAYGQYKRHTKPQTHKERRTEAEAALELWVGGGCGGMEGREHKLVLRARNLILNSSAAKITNIILVRLGLLLTISEISQWQWVG